MGFSAGGHVCADLATRFDAEVYAPVDAADRLSARPDIAAPIYAVQSMTPPLAHPGSRELLIGKDATPALERAHTPAANVTKRRPRLASWSMPRTTRPCRSRTAWSCAPR